jgi:hypothetical protein
MPFLYFLPRSMRSVAGHAFGAFCDKLVANFADWLIRRSNLSIGRFNQKLCGVCQ